MALIGLLAGVTTNALTFLHSNLYLVSMSHIKQYFIANPTSPSSNIMSPSPSKSYRLTLYFVCGRVLRESHDILELSMKSLKKGWNCGWDPSLRKLSIKNSLVARRTMEPIWKLSEIFWVFFFISQFLREFQDLRARLYHGPLSRTMEDGFSSWFDFMVQLPWSDFFSISICKVFGLLTRCKPNVD